MIEEFKRRKGHIELWLSKKPIQNIKRRVLYRKEKRWSDNKSQHHRLMGGMGHLNQRINIKWAERQKLKVTENQDHPFKNFYLMQS